MAILTLKNTNFTNTKTQFDRIVVSNKVSLDKKGFKYFIGYENDDEKVITLSIILPQMSTYRRDFNETKYMSFWHKR